MATDRDRGSETRQGGVETDSMKQKERPDAADTTQMSFGAHLEVLRQMLLRIIAVAGAVAVAVFCLKDTTWTLLLAPSECDFCTYRWIERMARAVGLSDFRFSQFHVDLIATDLSSQFMTHVSTSCYLGLLCASPYIVYELFRFVSPALYASERRYSVRVAVAAYALFVTGVLLTYYVLFPVAFRFLGTYSVDARIHSTITLDSYVSTFVALTLVMGVVFQLPVVAFCLARMGIVRATMLARYRRHAFLLIMVVSAVITPPDLMTLLLVSVPLYMLYELSIRVVRWAET